MREIFFWLQKTGEGDFDFLSSHSKEIFADSEIEGGYERKKGHLCKK